MLLLTQFEIEPRRASSILIRSFFLMIVWEHSHVLDPSSYLLENYQKSRACVSMASTDHEPNAVQVSKTADGITTITISRKHRRNAVG